MKMVLTDKAPRRNGLPGDEVDISAGCVRFFREQGWATPVDEVKKSQERDAAEALVDEYERLTGLKARSNWKVETLRTKVEDARNTYSRRDMRAED